MSFIPFSKEKKPNKRKRGVESPLNGVKLQNRFSALSDESMDFEDLEANNADKPQAEVKTAKVKVPPIVVYGQVNDMKNLAKLQDSLKEELTLKNKKNKTIIYTKNLEDYAIVEEDIKKSKVQYHTYTKQTEKMVKLVIKGLNENADMESIKTELQKRDLKIIEVKQLLKKEEGKLEATKIPVFIVTFPAETPIKEIIKVRRLCYTVIHWEKFKNSREVLQCYNCQAFGHVSSNCHREPNCLKCAGDHNTRDCSIKNKIENPKCVNCGGDHVASDTCCPVYQFVRDKRTRPQQQHNTPKRNYTTNFYRSEDETGTYRDRLMNRSSMNNNNNTSTMPSVSQRTNYSHNNTNNNNNTFSEIFGEIKDFIKNVNFTRIMNVVKNTFNKIKNESDGLSKAAIFIEGVVEIFS